MDPVRRVKPPAGVRVVSWLMGVQAFFLCLGGILLLLTPTDPATLETIRVGRGALQLIGFVMLGIGLLEFLLIVALRDGSNAARIIVTVFVGINAAGSLAQVVARAPTGVLSWIQLLFDVIILVMLWGTPNATEFFRGRALPAQGVIPSPSPPPPPPTPGL